MTDFLRIVTALQQQMSATFSRSDVLRPLHIMLGTMVILLLGLATAKAPEWLLICAACGLGATVVFELLAYGYCLFVDRDALRSERYHLQKMAIEARLIGDETAGLFEVREEAALPPQRKGTPKALPPPHPIESRPQSAKRVPKKVDGNA